MTFVCSCESVFLRSYDLCSKNRTKKPITCVMLLLLARRIARVISLCKYDRPSHRLLFFFRPMMMTYWPCKCILLIAYLVVLYIYCFLCAWYQTHTILYECYTYLPWFDYILSLLNSLSLRYVWDRCEDMCGGAQLTLCAPINLCAKSIYICLEY